MSVLTASARTGQVPPAAQLGLWPGPPTRRPLPHGSAPSIRDLRFVDQIWSESVPIEETPGEIYLAERGVNLGAFPDHGGLRWHQNCPWEDGAIPAILARFSDVMTGEPKGLMRWPLTGEMPMALGSRKGCVVRLDEEITYGLVVGKSLIKTMVAAGRVINNTLLRPAWVTVFPDGLRDFPVLPDLSLTILIDGEATAAAAEMCAKCWRNAGREVEIVRGVTA